MPFSLSHTTSSLPFSVIVLHSTARERKPSRYTSKKSTTFPAQPVSATIMASPSLKLYVDHLSQPARAVSILSEVVKAPYEEKKVALGKGEHTQKPFADINPFKKVPAVQDGDLRILETCAALRYIAAKYDSTGKWYPSDLKVRCKVDEYLDWQHANTRAHGVGIYFNKIIVPVRRKVEPDMALISKHEKEMARVEDQFASYFLGTKPFITGDSPTIADLVAAVEFEQPKAGGYKLAKTTEDFLERVRNAVGAELYDKMHGPARELGKSRLQ